MKKSGFRQTCLLILRALHGSIRNNWFKLAARTSLNRKKINALTVNFNGRNIFVFTPSVEWGFLFQRAQQMACSYAKHNDISVIYLTYQKQYDNFIGICEIEPHVYLLNAWMASKIDLLSAASTEVVSLVYDISKMDPIHHYHSDKLIYEYVDDLSVSISANSNYSAAVSAHTSLLTTANLTVATAQKLYTEIKGKAKHSILVPNGVDYAFFSQKAYVNPKISQLVPNYSCTIEYYGALASWFDYEVVKKSAQAHPDWLWILIGERIDNYMEKSGIENLSNVYYIPSVPYRELPSFMAGADILTIPFIINQITLATSPIKLFEYMAASKPIITSDMPECRKYKSVQIYHSEEEFEQEILIAKRRSADSSYHLLLEKEAQENTWDSRANSVLYALKEGIETDAVH